MVIKISQKLSVAFEIAVHVLRYSTKEPSSYFSRFSDKEVPFLQHSGNEVSSATSESQSCTPSAVDFPVPRPQFLPEAKLSCSGYHAHPPASCCALRLCEMNEGRATPLFIQNFIRRSRRKWRCRNFNIRLSVGQSKIS